MDACAWAGIQLCDSAVVMAHVAPTVLMVMEVLHHLNIFTVCPV